MVADECHATIHCVDGLKFCRYNVIISHMDIGNGRVVAFLMAVVVSPFVVAEVVLDKVNEKDLSVDGCGGITRMEGDNYWVVRDHGANGLSVVYPLTIKINSSSGKLESCEVGSGIDLIGNTDSEGIVYDAAEGSVWVSDEIDPSIREFKPVLATTAVVAQRTAPVPDIYRKRASGKGLEALALSPDGLTMWTANEEALTCDGVLSSAGVSTVVRLTRFVRANAFDGWSVSGQWAYRCQPAGSSLVPSYEFCGLSGLCALPDGSLLVLERETSTTTWGRAEIYRVPVSEFSAAKDVSKLAALDKADYSVVTKGKCLFSMKGGFLNIIVYEGICLGPKLSDGSLSILLVSDGGESTTKTILGFKVTAKTVSRLCALKLSGVQTESPSKDGIPDDWFVRNGYLAKNPTELANGKLGKQYGYTVGDIYATGIDPQADEPLRITGISFAGRKMSLEFNAVRVAPDSVCHIETCHDLGYGFTEVATGEGAFSEDRGVWRTTWSVTLPADFDASRFYRVRISR